MIDKVVWDRLLAVACAGVLCGILGAGLWPFTPHPRNQVAWLENGNGLRFGRHGTILSSSAFPEADAAGGAPCSLEIWVQRSRTEDSGTVLAFYSPENLVSFSLSQSISDLAIERQIRDRQEHVSWVRIYSDELFRQERQPFVSITAGAQGTAVYVNGALVKRASRFGLSRRDLTGQLVIANSPVEDDSWRGELRGLAIFDRELTATEVLEHFNSWTKNGRPAISEKGDPVALYLFDERGGSVVHNRAGSGPELEIPDHFLILRQAFLEVPWKEYHPGWSYYQDLLINIGGFIPLGFLFCGYFSTVRHLKRAQRITILCGFTVSLTIEVLQAYIPVRGSGMMDVMTNTLGTAIGAAMFHWKVTQAVFSRVGIPIDQ